MITIRMAGQLGTQLPANLEGKQREIYEELEKSSETFIYNTARDLRFEIILREQIIRAALLLKDSGASFTSFRHSNFNPRYWIKRSTGYQLKPTASPAEAVRDVFLNGDIYGFECSTAIVLIYYKAVLEVIGDKNFNLLFGNLLVWNWNYDPDLAIITRPGDEFIPGDVIYFFNPDYKKPIWYGENAVYLGKGLYFGHGIGIGTAAQMIEALNTLRKEGATQSAYLLNQHSRLNFRYLAQFSKN
ncbi:protein-glutamine gamma-glutamyltransferase [Mesobacillus harenae]|uniref:protein-glutamine gamma-glutamyltransferase n=1 Tax=Mesobacillus harenae TaxID=2213203 RepID=UPI001F557A30|nr:protein-glutamine gamma-glutamyltransferase [Mesobacillus harenae]